MSITLSHRIADERKADQPQPRRRSRRTSHTRTGWAFLIPLLALNALVIVGPSIATVFYSFTDWTGLGSASFVGLANYSRMVSDNDFRTALLHNLIYLAVFLTVPAAMGLLGAFILSQVTRFQMVFRVLFFIPYTLASVVNAALWKQILDPNAGLGAALAATGIRGLQGVSFFGSQHLALATVAFVDNWHWWGFVAVLFLTAMQSVDGSLYEAARVDGANRWRQFWSVTLPSIRPTLVFVLLMTVIWSLLVFDYVYILTQGGPGGSSEVVATLMYKQAFERFDAGYAAALGLGMSFVSAMVVAIVVLLRKRGWEI